MDKLFAVFRFTAACALIAAALGLCRSRLTDARPAPAEPLPSWDEGRAKKAILGFVARVTKEGSRDFVPVPERVAVFDNDGTLWCEQPLYVQAVFALDRVKALGKRRPEWKDKKPFSAILSGGRKALGKLSKHDVASVLAATHAGITTEEYARVAGDWLATAKHPRFKRRFTECVYQPQVELLAYLRANGFKTYLVTGGGVDFVRAFAEEVYGVPPEQVIGSSGKTRFELRDGKAVLVKLPAIGNVDDREGKPINIHLHIGRRPILAFGNSDGDLQMLQYTDSGPRPRLMLLVHHDDAEREYAYDRKSAIGRLDKALDEAGRRKWTVVSMKGDWKTIFPPRKPAKADDSRPE